MYTESFTTEELALANWARKVVRSPLQVMLFAASRPGIISFAMGLPAPELFPSDGLSAACRRVLTEDPLSLQYGPPGRRLKEQVVDLMARRGVRCNPAQVFLTTGAQQGMNLLVRLLLEVGGRVLTEESIYTGFQQVIEPYQPEVLTVPSDAAGGMDVAAVERLLAGGACPAFIYAISDGHNPLGVSLPAAKRARLAELARHYRVPIIEDDPYGALYYEGEPLRPLRAYDEQWVFYVGSFSKILAPALRVGWLVVPEQMALHLSVVKEASDIDTGTFTQRLISAFLDEQDIFAHLASLRNEYRLRRDVMAQALREHFPAAARWAVPRSGFFIWVELPREVDTLTLLPRALETERVAYIPGRAFSVGEDVRAGHCLRLNFSNARPESIVDGISRLGRVLTEGTA